MEGGNKRPKTIAELGDYFERMDGKFEVLTAQVAVLITAVQAVDGRTAAAATKKLTMPEAMKAQVSIFFPLCSPLRRRHHESRVRGGAYKASAGAVERCCGGCSHLYRW
jgi:hypothetical protein